MRGSSPFCLQRNPYSCRCIYIFRTQKQLDLAKEEAAKSTQETERLLQVVQMTQEEQNSKEKTIMDLQQ